MNYLLPLLPATYMACVFLLSSIPGNQPETLVGTIYHWVAPGWQDLLHIPLYAGLTLCWIHLLARYRMTRRSKLLIAFLLATLWGILDEIHQTIVPGRYSSLMDIALNMIGAAMALVYAGRSPLRGA
jgi:VanZ family protein